MMFGVEEHGEEWEERIVKEDRMMEEILGEVGIKKVALEMDVIMRVWKLKGKGGKI